MTVLLVHCIEIKEDYYIRNAIGKNKKVALFVKGQNERKNAILMHFLKAGFHLKALNAADFYKMDDVFDIKSFKSVAINTSLNSSKKNSAKLSATIFDKVFDNIYKLQFYNFENSKQRVLTSLKKLWKVDYILLLSLANWQQGYSWMRAIDLNTMELVYVHNYRASNIDNVNTVLNHFIKRLENGPEAKK